MDEIHKKTLLLCRSKIVRGLSHHNEVLDKLAHQDIFTPLMLDKIQATTPKTARVRKLLDDLSIRGPGAYDAFLYCLENSGQNHLAQTIKEKEHAIRNPGSTPPIIKESRFGHPTESSDHKKAHLHPRSSSEPLIQDKPFYSSHSSLNIAKYGSIVSPPSDQCPWNSKLMKNDENDDVRMENDADCASSIQQDRFHFLSIQCDGILIDCIVDKRIQSKYCNLYNDMERRSIKAKFNETEFYIEKRKIVSDLPSITTSYDDFETLYTYSKIQTRQTCEIKLLKVAVKKGQDLVCRWLLSHCSDNRLVLSIRPTKDNPAICRILSWTYTKLFYKQYTSYLNSCLVWPGTKCICKKKEDDTKTCFKKGRLIIVVESKATVYGLPPKFSSFRIQQITPEIRSKALREASTTLKIKLDSNSYYLDKSIRNDIAEELFRKHRNLSLLCPSQYKSQGYYRNHTIASSLCLQMFCRVKGIVPMGEEHLPSNIDGLETDVLEGCPSLLATNIKIGDKIGDETFTNHGILGGFCNYMGRRCFLTCAHVMYDVQDLLKDEDYLQRNKEVKSYVYTTFLRTIVECGRTIRRVFDHENSNNTSIDAALVEINSLIDVHLSDCVCDGMDFQSLGMTSLLLEDNCLDHRKLANQHEFHAIAVGVKLQQNIGIDTNSTNIGNAQAQVKCVNCHPVMLLNNAHFQMPITGTSQGQSILRMYNQMAVNIPIQPGDSGTCIYITGCPAGCGCIGMAIGGCNGFAFVTPLTEILRRL